MIVGDFAGAYNNPWDKELQGVCKKTMRELIPDLKSITFTKAILSSPLRPLTGIFYCMFKGFCPYLRTYVIAGMMNKWAY
jgi:hypothetical protein